MNRIIKFRAWDKKYNRWLNDADHILLKFASLSDDANENEWEIMQYTGLKDCKGKEIYEGDIIEMYIPETSTVPLKMITTVFLKEGIFGVISSKDLATGEEEILSLRDAIITSNRLKKGINIIGNKFEKSL